MSLASSTRIISSSSSSGDLARSRVNIADDDLGEEKVPVDDGVDGAKKSRPSLVVEGQDDAGLGERILMIWETRIGMPIFEKTERSTVEHIIIARV